MASILDRRSHPRCELRSSAPGETYRCGVSQPSANQPSQAPSWAASVRAEGASDHADVGMPEFGSFVIRYDHILDRRTGLHRCSMGGLRMLHAVLRL